MFMKNKNNQSGKKVYIYDGGYQGLLTALYQAFKQREVPVKIVAESNFRNDLFYQKEKIKTNSKKAKFFRICAICCSASR